MNTITESITKVATKQELEVMKRYTDKMQWGDESENEWKVFFKVNHQSFELDYIASPEECDWQRWMLAKALLTFQKENTL